MTTDTQTVILMVNLGDDAHPDEVNAVTTQLYTHLLQSKADHVEKLRGETMVPGAKGDPITVGAIILGVSVAVAPQIVDMVRDWLARRHLDAGANVSIKLGDDEITFPVPADSSPDELEALTERFVALLKKQGGPADGR